MMTSRQNLMAVLSGGSPEWMPACVHIANANNLPGYLPRALLEEPLDRLRISQCVGGDILYEIDAVRAAAGAGVSLATETRGETRVTTLTTPVGSLTQEMLRAAVPTPVYDPLPRDHVLPGPVVNTVHTRFFIKGPADYPVLQRYYESLSYTCDDELIVREQARVGETGLCVLGGGPSSPLYALAASHAGMERLCYDLFDAPEAVLSAMRTMTAAACRWYRAAAASSCGVIRCTEDLDTKLVSPEWFRRYALPSLAEYARICHAAGKIFIIHMCGPIRDFLPDLATSGVDAIHCLAPPPMGNTTVAEARRVLAGRVAAMLRLDANLLLHGDAAALDQAVAELTDELGDWKNALVIIPCGRASLDHIRRLIDRVRRR